MPASLSIIILTQDEAENLARCLEALAGLGEIIVVDSGSTDDTLGVAQRAGARIFQHPFHSFGEQRNWALAHCEPTGEWILFLDADEVVTPAFRQTLLHAISTAPDSVAGFYCCWKMMMNGRWLKHCDSFPKWQFRILRRGRALFADSGHGQKEGEVRGEVSYLREPYLHYAFSKGWAAWWARHNEYSSREARDRLERTVPARELFARDPSQRNKAIKPLVSRIPGWPLMRFLHMYVVKAGFLEGREGFTYCASMACYEFMIRLKMAELRKKTSVPAMPNESHQ